MRMIRRRPAVLALQLPRLDGTSWPDRHVVGRDSFDMNTLYEMGYREAFEPEAHAIAELLVDEVLPLIAVDDVVAEDWPYLRRTFMVAAQVGAGIGIVEARTAGLDERSTDRHIWGALWHALRELPAMAPQHRFVAAYMMQSGHYIARTDVEAVPLLLAELGRRR